MPKRNTSEADAPEAPAVTETPPADAAEPGSGVVFAASPTVTVLALSDLPQFGAKAGEVCEVPADQLEGLKSPSMLVDDNPAAVAAATAAAEG